jgi:hypothetical protein
VNTTIAPSVQGNASLPQPVVVMNNQPVGPSGIGISVGPNNVNSSHSSLPSATSQPPVSGQVNISAPSPPAQTNDSVVPTAGSNAAQPVNVTNPQQAANPYSNSSSYADPYGQQDQATQEKSKQDNSSKSNTKKEKEDTSPNLYEYMVMQPPSEPLISDPYEAQRRAALQAQELAEAYNSYLEKYYASKGYYG